MKGHLLMFLLIVADSGDAAVSYTHLDVYKRQRYMLAMADEI